MAQHWGFFLALYLVRTVYHCTDSQQRHPVCLSARRPGSQVQNRHQNRPGIASDEIHHDKSPCIYLQCACIALSAVLRFSPGGDVSYSTLSETTLWGFITVACDSEWRNMWIEERELRRKLKKKNSRRIDPFCFRLRQMKNLREEKRRWTNKVVFQKDNK